MQPEEHSVLVELSSIMKGFDRPWFVCGGWAIDLFLDQRTRPHEDIEMGVFRDAQIALRAHLGDWTMKIALNGNFVLWSSSEVLEPPFHEIRATNGGRTFEILLNECRPGNWVYRRCERVQRNLELAILYTQRRTIPFLAPEIVLLYKSRSIRHRDEQDFRRSQQKLNAEPASWLVDAIKTSESANHPWINRLTHQGNNRESFG